MKMRELIETLEYLRANHGDMDVFLIQGPADKPVRHETFFVHSQVDAKITEVFLQSFQP